MAAKKKTTTKKVAKKENNTIGLKILGAIINSVGLVLYTVANVPIVLSSLGIVIKIKYENLYTEQNIIDALKLINTYAIRETAIIFGSVLFFELCNYILYLKKTKNAILGMVVIEGIAFIVLGTILGFYYPLLYIMLLPVVLGLIDYAILNKEGK